MSKQSKAEQSVLRFLAAHQPGSVFNVVEVQSWLMPKYATLAEARAVPSESSLRKYMRTHMESLGRGQYRVPARKPSTALAELLGITKLFTGVSAERIIDAVGDPTKEREVLHEVSENARREAGDGNLINDMLNLAAGGYRFGLK